MVDKSLYHRRRFWVKEKINIASEILKYNSIWENTGKETIIANIEKYLYEKYPQCSETYNSKMEKMVEISGSKKDSVYSWINKSRTKIKVPFLKLCRIANALDVDIGEMLEEN